MEQENGAGDGSALTEIDDAGHRIMSRLDRMASISETEGQLTRRCYTPEHRKVVDLLAGWMRDSGMRVHEDAVGNLIGRYEGLDPSTPAIMLGSHFDTVINAGRYDGALGILVAIDCITTLNRRGARLDHPVEIACFVDEEGVRFQSTYLGSNGLAGTFDSCILDRRDVDGITMADAMRSFGLDPSRIDEAARKREDVHCYIEVHIEQGPVLEREGLSVCAVTAISGAVRMTVSIRGEIGHAGTVPMDSRHDALAAAAECILAVEDSAGKRVDAVSTVGMISASPGAVNVIPGMSEFTIDFRAADDEVQRDAIREMRESLQAIASRRGVQIAFDTSQDVSGITCAPWIVREIEAAMAELGHPPFRLPSGAGHDALPMAALTDVGMIFVRCKGGISHGPEEEITPADAHAASELLLRTVERIGGS